MNLSKVSIAFKKSVDKIIGTRDEYETRLNRIYGKIGHDEEVDKMRKRNKNLLIYGVVGFIVFSAILIYQEFFKEKYIIKDDGVKSGITAIKKSKAANQQIDLKVRSKKDGGDVAENVTINIKNDKRDIYEPLKNLKKRDDEWKSLLNGQIRQMENAKEDIIVLPKRLSNNMTLYWDKRQNNSYILPLVFIIVFLIFLHKRRFSGISTFEKRARESIEKQLPGFINKIVLLMGSGMVFEKAFEKAVLDSSKIEVMAKSYFYIQMNQILGNTKKHRKNLLDGLYDFAKRNEDRNLIRVAGLIGDNLEKGDKLAEKLQVESQIMWFNKKKTIEEKGRISETKLVFPMVIMLGVLVVITVSPALIDM